jgi:hypothetical protein
MKLIDPSFLNMDKILKNLSDFMKKNFPQRCTGAGGAETGNWNPDGGNKLCPRIGAKGG